MLLFGKSERSFLKVYDDLTGCRFGRVQEFAWNLVGIGICPFSTVSFPTLHHKSRSLARKRGKWCNLRFSFFLLLFFYLQIHCCRSWLAASKRSGGRRASPRCLFICTIISSCTKEQRQDIWCNTIAGSVPRGAPVCCVQSDHRTGSVQAAAPELLLPVTREPQRRITVAYF